jgi:hypothetical protein
MGLVRADVRRVEIEEGVGGVATPDDTQGVAAFDLRNGA